MNENECNSVAVDGTPLVRAHQLSKAFRKEDSRNSYRPTYRQYISYEKSYKLDKKTYSKVSEKLIVETLCVCVDSFQTSRHAYVTFHG